MRSPDEVREVFRLAAEGCTQSEIARRVGIGQPTVSRWLRRGAEAILASPQRTRARTPGCPDQCPIRSAAPPTHYAYLLGQYLGDGTVVHTGRAVYRMFLACCAGYPDIIEECRQAIAAVLPTNAIGHRRRPGLVELSCYSTHWPCLLPQHGPGKKHHRRIVLEPWQQRIALELHPALFIRGLVHSDGCRSINRVRGTNGHEYAYPRYFFTNRSTDIRRIFTAACDRLGVEWRHANRFNGSVARRSSVAKLDAIIGPKS